MKKIMPFKVNMPESTIEPLKKVLASGFVGQGSKVDQFEREFSRKFNIKNVVSVNSCTSALRLALALINVKSGDEVISTPYTWIGTNTVILEQFAKPVFADIQYKTANIDPKDIEHRITEKTKAIICVHWGGYPCDMDKIHNIAKKHNLPVIEDAAQALGAKYKNRHIGTISQYNAFSFQAIKHITTGDGGMLSVLNNDKFNEAKRRRWFGIDRENRKETLKEDPFGDIKEIGYKYHMNDIAATIGIEQLKYFDVSFKKRAEIVHKYREELKDILSIKLLENKSDRKNANWMFAIHIQNRDKFIDYMTSKGIGVTIHNWRNDKYSIFGGLRNDLPNLNKLDKTLVNLPIHQDITDIELSKIIDEIRNFDKNIV